MNKIKLFVFDMGGVLVRNFQVKPRLFEYFTQNGIDLELYSDSWKNWIYQHGKGLIEEKEMWYRISKEINIPIKNENESLLGKFFAPTIDEPTKKVIETLKNKNHRVVCGTNVLDSHYRIHNELHQYDVFDKVYASHLIHEHKPEKEFYMYISNKEKVLPHEIFFTDDFEENVIAAKELGINAFLYKNAQLLEEHLHSLNAL